MLNFSIMTLEEEHLEEYCQDIAFQVRNGIATMPLFNVTLTPEGDPAIDKAELCCSRYERYKARLDEMGIASGILIQATIGHGWKLNQQSAFQKYVGLSDGVSPEVCCPLDKGFQAYIRAAGARIAAAHPAHIMLDDDFRLMGARSGHGCACPLHMKAFEKLAGHPVSREELWDVLNREGEQSRTYREMFIKSQIDSLLECVTELRRGIDSVDPTIPGSFCLAGTSAEGAYEIAAVMAGKNNPVVLRVNNANYCAQDPRGVIGSVYNAAMEMAALNGKPDMILAETDTCPQNRYSTPAAKLHTLFSFSLMEGMSGAKHWITRLSSYEPNSGKAYRKKLAAYSGFYRELTRITPELSWLGCNVVVPKGPVYELTPRDRELCRRNPWYSPFLDRMGVPVYFSNQSTGVCFFGGASEQWFTDDELKHFLLGKTVFDAAAAMGVSKRGLGQYLGVDVKRRAADAKNASGEVYYPEGSSVAPYEVHELIPHDDDVRRYSEIFYLCDGVRRETLFPGVTAYRNRLNGTAVVYAGVSDFPYNLTAAFGFLNETRKAQLVRILKDLDCLPIYYPDDAEVFMKAAKTKDGRLFCAVLNMSLDAVEELPLVTENPVRSVRRLMPDGSYEAVGFVRDGDRLVLSLTACPYDPVILLMDV